MPVEPFDFMWKSRKRDQSLIIQITTATSRDRVLQLVSEVLRILTLPGLFITNEYNIELNVVDLTPQTRHIFQMNVEATFWMIETA